MTSRKNDKGRGVTPEEKELWRRVTESTVPLDKTKNIPAPEKPAPAKITVRPSVRVPPPVRGRENLVMGEYANIDRNTADKFRRGHYPIDATLDLHGMTAAKAQIALTDFIGAHWRRQSRCLLIVTGKGKSGEGVLKRLLPMWLADDNLSPMILALDAAKARHGGSGAFYVLLRRKR